MLFLVGNVGEPIGYVFCVFPLVEFCLRPDFRVYTVENLIADFTEFGFCGINKAAGWVVGEVVLVVFYGIEHSMSRLTYTFTYIYI